MVLNFDFWYQQLQNGLHTAEKNCNTLYESYPSIRLESKPLTTFYKALYIAEKLGQKLKIV